jgi:hypothetical protein
LASYSITSSARTSTVVGTSMSNGGLAATLAPHGQLRVHAIRHPHERAAGTQRLYVICRGEESHGCRISGPCLLNAVTQARLDVVPGACLENGAAALCDDGSHKLFAENANPTPREYYGIEVPDDAGYEKRKQAVIDELKEKELLEEEEAEAEPEKEEKPKSGGRVTRGETKPAKKTGLNRVPGARKRAMPGSITPQLATLVDKPPDGAEWLHEIKYDGYRMVCRIDGSDVRILSRNGKDWTAELPSIAKAVKRLKVKSAWVDGEVAVMSPDGRTSTLPGRHSCER